jgi:Flp pilus assembly protein TadB
MRPRKRGSEHSPLARFFASVGLLVGFFALLVAAAHPQTAAVAVAGGLGALLLRRAYATLRTRELRAATPEAESTRLRSSDSASS